MPRNVILLALAACLAAVAGCSEDLEGGAACPALCPEQRPELREIVIDPFAPTDSEPAALDTTVIGFPIRGTEAYLLAASRGDTLDSRVIVRFDTLQNRYRPPNVATGDSLITAVKRAWLFLRVASRKVTAPVTVEVYDVTDAADDTSTAALAAEFTAGNLIGSRTYTPDSLADSAAFRDTLLVPIDTAVVRAAVVGGTRLRIGVRVTSAESAQLRFFSRELANGPRIRYDPAPAGMDSARFLVSTLSSSRTPTDLPTLRSEQTDFTIVPVGLLDVPGDALVVGGLPGKRGYLRFALPDSILNTATVLRATLILHQRSDVPIDPADTLYIMPHVGIGGSTVADVQRAAALIGGIVGGDSLLVVAGQAGERRIELAPVIRGWTTQNPDVLPRAIILRAGTEGVLPVEARFYSSEAPELLRPRLRITYTPRIEFGLP